MAQAADPDPVAALTASLAADFGVSHILNDPTRPHPRFAQYKSHGSHTREAAQAQRRAQLLAAQKQQRQAAVNWARDLTATDSDQDDDEDDPPEAMDTAVQPRSKPRSTFRDRLMLSEWMVDVPADLGQSWLYVLVPEGRRNLVVAGRGQTSAYARHGRKVSQFPSALPGGNRRQRPPHHMVTLLDCIYSPTGRCYYVLDVLVWNGHEYLGCESEFRFFWLKQKAAECPAMGVVSDINPIPFRLLPEGPADLESLTRAVHDPWPFSDNLDGILFYHKQLHYLPGHTPLVGWLKPYMLPEMLQITVPPALRSLAPSDYVNSQQYMADFDAGVYHKTKGKSTPSQLTRPSLGMEVPEPVAQPHDSTNSPSARVESIDHDCHYRDMSRGGGRGRKKWRSDNGFEAWGGYMAAKIAKLEGQFSTDAQNEDDGDEKGLFHGIAIFVNGYTSPSADQLKRIMMMNGGTFHHYFNAKKTTHIIATNLPDTKVKNLKGNEPICHPRWISESLQAGKVLDYRKYLLYSAQTTTQPKLNFPSSTANPPPKPIEPEKPHDLPMGPAEPVDTDGMSSSSPLRQNQVDPEVSGSSKALNATDSRFLGEFYNNSRLHHISTMGANFKRYVNELRDKHDGNFPDRHLLPVSPDFKPGSDPVFMHIDMDCFFVSVGLRQRPDLLGKPVAVAHAKGAKSIDENTAKIRKTERSYYQNHFAGLPQNRSKEIETTAEDLVEFSSMSELASVSYEAREFGVKNGMFLGPALALCPNLKTIPYDFEGYNQVAYTLYDTVAKYTLDIQAVSCDEMLVDITEVISSCRIDPLDFAQEVRTQIQNATQCHASVGLGPNLLLARMATRQAKPNGKFHLSKEDSWEFMKSIPVRDLPGVGRKMKYKMQDLNVATCGDLQSLSLSKLQKEFGAKTGQSLHNFCRGLDDRELNVAQERKSVSAEVNYGIRFKSQEDCSKFLEQLSGEVAQRLEKLGVRGKTVTLKLMIRSAKAPEVTSKFMGHGICDSVAKTSTLSTCTNDKKIIFREVSMLCRQLTDKFEDLRGLGVQIGKLDGNTTGINPGKPGQAKTGTKSILNFVQKVDVPKVIPLRNPPLPPPPPPPPVPLLSSSNSSIDPCTSFSQIDMDVYESLPEDIKQELESLKSTKSGQPKILESNPSLPHSNPKQSSDIMTFSQLDPEFLAALPEEMVDELREQYSRSSLPAPETAFDMIMKPKAAPTTPVKTPPKKRGRPPKNSPRFIKRSRNSNPAITPPKISKDVQIEGDSSRDAPMEEEVVIPEKTQANLEGFRDMADLRTVLGQWLTTDIPTPDDTSTVAAFFQELIDEKDLEKVSFLLKLIHRLTRSKSGDWKRAYTLIVEKVQMTMIEHYGYQLSTNNGD
ncbi:hypothetical protein TCAL_06254 [Tigriopus californicus]|uniref:DNA repair protein REV1 n=2 Tax=Tigriopus californicus TaxID=6832 RepID=A0A553N8P2_TIGCA|nr:hypothetical protein TCAL_06254 [Tigriopus californicus]